jgi:DNA-directed RNA polymerase specialized sigma24 family protein
MLVRDMILLLERLEELLPPLPRTNVNDRTVYICRLRWLENFTVGDIAMRHGWSAPAVEWHLRRAMQVLEAVSR